MRNLVTASLAAFLVGCVASPAPEPPETLLLPGRGVAGPGGTVGYFPAPKGGVVAIDLASGNVLWSNKEAMAPLAADADCLYARAVVPGMPRELRVVALDAKRGKSVLRSDAVELPDWVELPDRVTLQTKIRRNIGQTFAMGGRLDGGRLLLAWEARDEYPGGPVPGPGQKERYRKSASGAAWVDLTTGTVRVYEPGEVPWGLPETARYPETVEAGGRTFTISDTPENVAITGPVMRILHAKDATGKWLWHCPIGAPVRLWMPL